MKKQLPGFSQVNIEKKKTHTHTYGSKIYNPKFIILIITLSLTMTLALPNDTAGGSQDVATPNNEGESPLHVACSLYKINSVKWLILNGAVKPANLNDIMVRDVPSHVLQVLAKWVDDTFHIHKTFLRTFLHGVHSSIGSDNSLFLLKGMSEMRRHIGEYAGVICKSDQVCILRALKIYHTSRTHLPKFDDFDDDFDDICDENEDIDEFVEADEVDDADEELDKDEDIDVEIDIDNDEKYDKDEDVDA
jgi:hypothetical protein